MKRKYGRGREVVSLASLLACMLLACPCLFALDPSLDVSQYAHTAWKIRDGFSEGIITSIAQTPDGYLWLGTEFGLLRFDGVRNVHWQPPPGQPLPSSAIWSLLAARDGTLWIGTAKGLASWKDSKLTQYPELVGQSVPKLLEDRGGSIWAGVYGVPRGRLCAFHNGSVRCYGDDDRLGLGVLGLYEDSKGSIWLGVQNGVWRWKPDPPEFHAIPDESDSIQSFIESDDGTLLIGARDGIMRLVDGKAGAYPLPGPVPEFQTERLLRDRDGGVWIGTRQRGLVHLHHGRTDVFSQSVGLSGDDIRSLFEDREGNIWVATSDGLDRFRDFAVTTFTGSQGLSNAQVLSVLAARDGSVWFGTLGGLNRWSDGQVTIPRTGTAKQDGKLNGLYAHSLFQDDRGRVWISTLNEVGYLENDRFISSGVPGGNVHGFAQDTRGNLWIAHQDLGLLRISGGSEVQRIPRATIGHKDNANALAADPLHGGLWMGFYLGGIAYFADGQVRASYAAADGLGEGIVSDLRLDPDGTLWAATAGGLSQLKNGHVATLTSRNGLPCDTVHWVIEDDAHSFWLYMACGLVRIPRAELEAWAAGVDKDKAAKRTIQATRFDSSDGVRGMAFIGGYRPLVAKSPDGKLWFTGVDGVSVVDPRHVPFNPLPPPVHIEQITADRKTYDPASALNGRMSLPPLTRDLEIDYTALSFVAPEKERFRYKLEGWDRDWQDVGNRRQAFYNNLPPRNFRFRVIASNNSGVWNEAGTFLDFSVAPAYYQTTWFRLSVVAAFLALLGALYQLRLRQVARQFNIRLEERVSERTRIARELHDTLLQSFQGVLLRFHTVTYLLPDRPDDDRHARTRQVYRG